jgi:hypothetical protein
MEGKMKKLAAMIVFSALAVLLVCVQAGASMDISIPDLQPARAKMANNYKAKVSLHSKHKKPIKHELKARLFPAVAGEQARENTPAGIKEVKISRASAGAAKPDLRPSEALFKTITYSYILRTRK